MATVKYNGQTYNCATAYKGADYVHLVDAEGCMIASFEGVSDFSGFELSDCEWASPKAKGECNIAVVREDGSIVKSDKRLCDPADGIIDQNTGGFFRGWSGTSEQFEQQKDSIPNGTLCIITDDITQDDIVKRQVIYSGEAASSGICDTAGYKIPLINYIVVTFDFGGGNAHRVMFTAWYEPDNDSLTLKFYASANSSRYELTLDYLMWSYGNVYNGFNIVRLTDEGSEPVKVRKLEAFYVDDDYLVVRG